MAKPRTIGNLVAPWRFLVFFGGLIAAALIVHPELRNWPLTWMAAFDFAAAIFLMASAPLLSIDDPKVIEDLAAQNDGNRTLLLVLTGIVMAVLLLAIAGETVGHPPQPFTRILIIATLIFAWLFSNTVYALHYAHLGYVDPRAGCHGLDFPRTPLPLYWDFVYFAFTLGMTFQTSDVTVTSPRIRRVVSMHCLAAFFFNIGVLAFTINVLGSS